MDKARFRDRGELAWVHAGDEHNGSQFFITFKKCEWLNRKHIVFGKCIAGEEILDKIEEAGSEYGEVSKEIIVSNCGEINDT